MNNPEPVEFFDVNVGDTVRITTVIEGTVTDMDGARGARRLCIKGVGWATATSTAGMIRTLERTARPTAYEAYKGLPIGTVFYLGCDTVPRIKLSDTDYWNTDAKMHRIADVILSSWGYEDFRVVEVDA